MCSRERSAFKECIVVSRARKIFLKNNTPPSALLCLFETLSLLTRVGKHTREEETTQPREQKFKKKKKKREILDEKSLLFCCEYSVHVTHLNEGHTTRFLNCPTRTHKNTNALRDDDRRRFYFCCSLLCVVVFV